MARYTIVSRLITVPLPTVLGEAESAAEAYKKAQEFARAGKLDVRIGDAQTQTHYDVAAFAAANNLR